MTTPDLSSAITYVENHAPVRAWLLGRKRVADIVNLTMLEINMATRINLDKEELVRRVAPRLRRSFGRFRMPYVARCIFLVHEWYEMSKQRT